MIVFQGFGFVALILMVLGQIIAYETAGRLVGTPVSEDVTNGMGMLLAAPVVWFLGRWLNRDAVRLLLDPATGEQVRQSNHHTLFWLRMEWWGLGLALLGSGLLGNSLFGT